MITFLVVAAVLVAVQVGALAVLLWRVDRYFSASADSTQPTKPGSDVPARKDK